MKDEKRPKHLILLALDERLSDEALMLLASEAQRSARSEQVSYVSYLFTDEPVESISYADVGKRWLTPMWAAVLNKFMPKTLKARREAMRPN